MDYRADDTEDIITLEWENRVLQSENSVLRRKNRELGSRIAELERGIMGVLSTANAALDMEEYATK